MRLALFPALAAILLPISLGCDSVDVGRLEEEPGAPRFIRLLVIDENRGLITDVFNTEDQVACSEINPCTPAYGVFCAPSEASMIPEGELECSKNEHACVCLDITKPINTPPPVADIGFSQIRLVFSERLAPSFDEAFTTDPSIVQVSGPEGMVEVDSYYDPAGHPTLTTDPIFLEGWGPAIALRPTGSLLAGATYTVTLDAARMTDQNGEAVNQDKMGPLQPSYTFTTEPLAIFEDQVPEAFTTTTAPFFTNDVIQVVANAPIDDANEATRTASGAVDVVGPSGPVAVTIWLDRGGDPADCAAGTNPRLLNVARSSTTASGVIDWEPGEYTITYAVKAEGSTSEASLEATFVVADERGDPAEAPFAVENFVLPEQCQ